MTKNFYLDMYSLPSIDFQDKILNQGHPVPIDEYNEIFEKIYRTLRKTEQIIDDEHHKSIIKISEKFVVINLATYLKFYITFFRLDNYNIKFTDKKIYHKLIGERAYGKNYLYDFLDENKVPFIDYWLRDFNRSKKREILKTIYNVVVKHNSNVVIYRRNNWIENSLKSNGIKYSILPDQFFWKNSQMPDNTDYFDFSNKEVNNLINKLIENLNENLLGNYNLSDNANKDIINILSRIIYKIYFDYFNCFNNLKIKILNLKRFIQEHVVFIKQELLLKF
jgi:hypothetical protein